MEDDFEELFSKYEQNGKPITNLEQNLKPIEKPEEEVEVYKAEFADITQETTASGRIESVYRTNDQQQQRRNEKKFGDKALVLRRIVQDSSSGAVITKNQLEIQSDTLRAAFRNIASHINSVNLHHNPIIIPEPFVELYHCRHGIKQAIEEAEEGPLRDEIELLQTFDGAYMTRMVDSILSFERCGLISFEFIRQIFVPGELVVIPNRLLLASSQWCGILRQCQIVKTDKATLWEVTVEYTTFDGSTFGMVSTRLRFPFFDDVRKIIELPVYPLKFHHGAEALQKSLVRRGVMYQSLCMRANLEQARHGPGFELCHYHYRGPLWELPHHLSYEQRRNYTEGLGTPSIDGFLGPPSETDNGRVIIDPAGYYGEYSQLRETIAQDMLVSEPAPTTAKKPLPHQPLEHTKSLTAQEPAGRTHYISTLALATLPPFIPAFSLSRRLWGFYLVENLVDIQWQDNAYESLQLDQKRKDSVRRLVQEHQASYSDFDDFIAGKGKGLVFLLHGPPGSGKTMTAETVAESLHRPLYYTSGGELGLRLSEIEQKLHLVFKRIERWGAVLLFDEADTFMAKRGEDNLERNALVSILLRKLEYQSGILFLTTNRIQDFDTAFYSRIHLQLPYKQPNASQRTFIWTKLADKIVHDISRLEFESLGDLPMDGRRIKNVLRVASLLAKSKGQDARMNIADVKESLQISAVDTSEAELESKIEDFCL